MELGECSHESNHEICRVGYALHAKKLRASDHSPTTTQDSSKNKSDCNWRGGGLSDILHQEWKDVVFEPFDFEKPIDAQVMHIAF